MLAATRTMLRSALAVALLAQAACACSWFEEPGQRMSVTNMPTLYSGDEPNIKWQYEQCCSALGVFASCKADDSGSVRIRLLEDGGEQYSTQPRPASTARVECWCVLVSPIGTRGHHL